MDLEGIVTVVGLLLHWRIAASLVASSVTAALLVHVFPWLTGLQGIVLAMFGLLPGLLWEAQATAAQRQANSKPANTSGGVAGAAAVIAGATWGVMSSTSSHSFFAGAVILSFASWVWARYAMAEYHVAKERVIVCVLLAVAAYPIAALVGHGAL